MAIHITTAAHTLAQLQARKAVKAELQRRGEKVSHYAAKEISALAQEYLAQHCSELMPDAIATIERWILAGEFGKRAQRAFCAKLTTNAQNQIELNSTCSAVQMSGGYARVSTDGQTLDVQQAALAEAGCERVFSEKQNGAKTDRPQLAKAIAALAAGDTLIVAKLDRPGQSAIGKLWM